MCLRIGLVVIILSSLAPQIAVFAQGSIQLAVDAANFDQDGLLVLFGGLRRQGEIGLPVGSGDINGDGRGDVIFCGMFGSSGNRTNNGVVNFYISDGRDSGFVDQAQNPPNIFRLHGARSGDLLGTSVSANGDVNGDGIRDVAIGASSQDGPGNGISDNRGAAYIVLGSHDFNANAELTTLGPPPAGVIVIYGPQSGGRMGIWVDEGDVDGDGVADIVIGSDQINSGGSQHVGGAYIVFGSPTLPSVIDLANPPAGVRIARIVGAHQEDHWGAALQVGDINDDGIGDIIIGGSIFRDSASYVSPNDDNGHDARAADFGGTRVACGEVFVIYGRHDWPADTFLNNPPSNATHVIGANPVDYLGSQVHSGDVNGDGRTDLIIGALQATAPDNRGKTGAAYVVYGSADLPGAVIDLANPDASGSRITTIYGEHALDCAGDSVRAYDINNDGLSDLFVGSPERTFMVGNEEREDTGVTELIFGQRDFLPPVIKLYDPPASPPIFRLAGARSGDEFSYRLTGADVDGDGYIDYISNAMHGDGFGNGVLDGGNVYVFSGKKLSAKLGMLGPPEPADPPILTSAVLRLNGQVVQQANTGQPGLRVTIQGAGFNSDSEVAINGVTVTWNFADLSPGSPILVELDANPAVRDTAGQLAVRVRNTNPLSAFSNELVAGRLVGLEITSIKVVRKAAGAMVLKIRGANFPGAGVVQVIGNGTQVPLKSTSFLASDFIRGKIAAAIAPAAGVTLHVRVIATGGAQSNEFTVTAP
ncbi:MAG: integrin alpha [Blastocatellia bacterium]